MTVTYNPSWFTYLWAVFSGAILVFSVSNWFFMWVGFELSLIGFLPMMKLNFFITEGMMKYFLVQAGGSGLFLMSFFWNVYVANLICLLSVALKLGLFPFYHWVASVLSNLSWDTCFFLVTIQKIPALCILCYMEYYPILWLSSFSVFVGGVLGLNQVTLRGLMGYSSVGHTGWLGLCSLISTQYLIFYFCLYFFINLILFTMLMNFSSAHMGLGNVSLSMSLLLFTLGGLPPFSIFFMKISVLFFIYPQVLSLALVLIGSMSSIFYYLMFMIPSGILFSTYESTLTIFLVTLVCLNFPLIFIFSV